VLFEDSAALLGLFIAAIGIWTSHRLGDARIDGIASIAIGLILAAVAILLAREAKDLLIGESADPELINTVWDILASHREIVAINHVRTIHTAPDAIFVAISADFEDVMMMGDGEALIEEIEAELKQASPRISSIYIRPEKHADAIVQQRPGIR
jgi:divalent metal cation (Fe/Co/Zn/Cd) transporter